MESSILTWDNLERAYQQLSDQLHIGAAIQILGLTKLEAAELQGYIKRLLDEDLDRHGGTASPTPFLHEVFTKNWRSRFPGLEIWNTQPNLWIEAAFKKCIRAVEEYKDLESFVVSHEQFPLDESSSGDSTPGSSRSGNTQIPDCLFCAENCDCPPPTKYRHVSTEPQDDPRVNDSTWQHVDNPDSPGHEAFEDHLGFSTTGNPASSTTAGPSSNQRPSTSAITGPVFPETDRSKHSERPHQAARLFPSATQTRNGLANFCPSPAPYTNQDLVPVATQSAQEYRGRGPRGENTSAPRRVSRSPTRGPVPSGALTVRNPRARPSESYRPPPFLAPQIAPTSERHPLLSVQYEPMLNYFGAGSAALYPYHRREDPVRREDEDRGDRPSSSSAGPESTPRPVVRPLPFSCRPLPFTAGPSLYRQRSPPRHHSPPRQRSPPRYSPPRYSPPRQCSPPRSPINRRPSPVYDDDPFERNDPDYRRPSPLALAHHDLHREGVTTTLVRDEIDDTRWIYRRHGSNSSDGGYYHNNPPRQRYVYKGPFRLRGGAAPRDSDSHHHHDSRRRDDEPPFELHGDNSPTSDVSSPPPPPNSPCASLCKEIFSTGTTRLHSISSSIYDSDPDTDPESSRSRPVLQAINRRKEEPEDRPPPPIRPPSPQPPHPWVPYPKQRQSNADHLTTAAKEKGKTLATELRPPRPIRPPSFLQPRPWVPYTNRADTEHLTTDWAYSPATAKGKALAAELRPPRPIHPLSPPPPCPWVPDEDTEPLTTSWRCSPPTTTKEKGKALATELRPPRPFRPLSPPPPRPWAPYSRTADTQGHNDGKHLIPVHTKEKEKGEGMGMNELRPPRPIRPPSPQPPRPWVPYSRTETGTGRDAQFEHPRHRHRAASRGRESSRRWEDSGSSSSDDESRVRRVSRDKEEEEEEVVLVRVRGRGVVDGLMRGGARVFD